MHGRAPFPFLILKIFLPRTAAQLFLSPAKNASLIERENFRAAVHTLEDAIAKILDYAAGQDPAFGNEHGLVQPRVARVAGPRQIKVAEDVEAVIRANDHDIVGGAEICAVVGERRVRDESSRSSDRGRR